MIEHTSVEHHSVNGHRYDLCNVTGLLRVKVCDCLSYLKRQRDDSLPNKERTVYSTGIVFCQNRETKTKIIPHSQKIERSIKGEVIGLLGILLH